jgi:hypothetical protein
MLLMFWYVVLRTLLIAMMLIMAGCHQPIKDCGIDPNASRILMEGPLIIPGDDNSLKLNIQATEIKDGKGYIYIHTSIHQRSLSYVSMDHGHNWQLANMPKCTQIWEGLTATGWTGCIMSKSNLDICYRPKLLDKKVVLELSMDRGNTWKTIYSKYQDGRSLTQCILIGTSLYKEGRVYAIIRTDKLPSIGVSDDYGATFRLYDSGIHECRSNRNRIFDVSPYPNPFLLVSNNEGKSWERLPGAGVLFSPLYENYNRHGILKNINENGWNGEKQIELPHAVQQIECDPKMSEVFYILNSLKGIYRTHNNGKTFTVLPIGEKKYLNISEIAVDPVVGGIIYAAIGRDKIYRSEDYGCSWELLRIP